MEKQEIKALLDSLGLSVSFQFVPFSQSRNKGEKDPSLNYIVTVHKNGNELFKCDYTMGCGHAPSYKQFERSIDGRDAIKYECETGRAAKQFGPIFTSGTPILPDIVGVFYSLVSDADAIDYTFEDWASNFGFDSDSREAERMYNECIKQAIQLRSAIGDTGLKQLQEAYQDY